MRRIFIFIFLFFMSFFLCGCEVIKKEKHWHFGYDIGEIEEIRIVYSNGTYNNYDDYEVLGYIDISKAQDLCMDIEHIEFRNWIIGSPGSPSGFCFLFIYTNKEADLISYHESLRYRCSEDNEIKAHFSWLNTEKENVYRLILKYLSNSCE